MAFIRVSSQHAWFKPFNVPKPQALRVGSRTKLTENPISRSFRSSSSGLAEKSPLENGRGAKSRLLTHGFCLKHLSLPRARSFSSSFFLKADKGSSVVRNRKVLPWRAGGQQANEVAGRNYASVPNASGSSWEESERFFLRERGTPTWDGNNGENSVETVKNLQKDKRGREVGEHEEERAKFSDNQRWDQIKRKSRGRLDARAGYEKPAFRGWGEQENWARQTRKKASESTIPKMIGEGIYGVGSVLAALSAQRREFYTLYFQEGIDLSRKNRKKDRKAFEKVLMMADKLGLSRIEKTKHDLNMMVDSRPHQGLVLDASPLETIDIKKLDRAAVEGGISPVWLALDEIMDPQNLGAIIRSAYFFGASGVVVCAKNSAPLSGVVSKASAGSLELIELRSCKNMMQFLASSSHNGWRVLGGSVSSDASPLNEVSPGTPSIIVLGNEGTGLRPLVEMMCSQLVRIPGNIVGDVTAGAVESNEMNPGCSKAEFQPFLAVESLNVSVAAGVLLYHLLGNRHGNICNLTDSQINAPE